MEGVRRSRGAHSGVLTKAQEKLDAMPFEHPDDVKRIKASEVKAIMKTLLKTEAGFSASMDEAQEFTPTDETAMASFQEEELEVADAFHTQLYLVRTLGEQILACKTIFTGVATFDTSLSALQESLDSEPDMDHTTSLSRLQTLLFSLKEQWMEADLSSEHPLQTDLDHCERRLTQKEGQVAAAKTRATPSTPPMSSSMASSSTCGFPHPQQSKLPMIRVPTFDGNVMGWSTFWATFTSTVDSRRELDSSQKLNYLRQAIKAPALQLLMNSPLEGPDTYQDLVDELKDRFQKKKEIHQAIVKTITSITSPKYTRDDLRLLYDTVKTSISNLKSTSHYDIESFLSSLIYSILPIKLQILWDQANKDQKGVLPILELLRFIKDHAETLPASTTAPVEKTAPAKRTEQPARGRNNVHTTSSAPVAASEPPPYRWECFICKPEKHPLFRCPKWEEWALPQKLALIAANQLCSNCLHKGHTTEACKSKYRCTTCHQKHHTSIHQQSTIVNHATLLRRQVPDALMTTAQLLLIGPNGIEVKARALIDSGSGISLVTQRIAHLLQLVLEPAELHLMVVQGESSTPLKHLTQLAVAPLDDRTASMPCEPAVADIVTANIPSQPAPSVLDLPHMRGLHLADDTYNLPGHIDILLGAEMAPSIFTRRPPQKGKTTEPMAHATVFGWAIIGPVPGFNTDPSKSILHLLPRIVPTDPSEPSSSTSTSTLHSSTISSPEKKSTATTQDETSHHKPQKGQLNSVADPAPSFQSLLGPPPTMPSSTTSFQTPARLLNHSRHHDLALDSESEAQRAPLPKRPSVYQPHPGSPSTTLSNSKTDSRSANSTEESNIPLMPAKPQNQSDGSDSTCRPTSLLPSQEPGTQQTDPEEEVTSSLKNCDQPQLTSSLCSSAKDEDTSTNPINSQSVSRNDILEQQPAALQPPIMMTSTRHILGEAILPQTLSTECQTPQQISLPPAATRSQPPAINPIHHTSSEVTLPQIPSTKCQAPQRIRLLQATTIFQQNISREHSGEIASSIFQSTQLNLHQAPSLLEKLDTVKLTRLFFNQQPHPISNLPSTNNRLLINTVSSNPVTRHYWIDASIYFSWLKDQFTKRCSPPDTSTECQTPQQIPLSTVLPSTHRVTLPKNPSVKCQMPQPVRLRPTTTSILQISSRQPSGENTSSVLQSIHVQQKQQVSVGSPKSSISTLPEKQSSTQPVQPTKTTKSIGILVTRKLLVLLLTFLHFMQQINTSHYSIKLDEHRPPSHCNQLQSLLAVLWPMAVLQAVLLPTTTSQAHPLQGHRPSSDATDCSTYKWYQHLSPIPGQATSTATGPNLHQLSARRLSKSTCVYQCQKTLPYLINEIFFDHDILSICSRMNLTDLRTRVGRPHYTTSNIANLCNWNNSSLCHKTSTVKSISFSYHLPFNEPFKGSVIQLALVYRPEEDQNQEQDQQRPQPGPQSLFRQEGQEA